MAQEPRAASRARVKQKAPPKRSLRIEVVWGGIDAVQADVLLVGHYLGVLPQTAERKLDELVSGTDGRDGKKLLITELTRRGAIRGDLGQVLFFPTPDGRQVALGGMGSVGTFGITQVRTLARSVAQVIGLLPTHRVLATVLIGSGKGNLKVTEALHAFLEGLAEALSLERLDLGILKIVERDLDRALEILAAATESAVRLNAQRAGRPGLDLFPQAALTEGKGGDISPDFGCSMMLAALASGNGRSGLPLMSRALRDVLSHLPQKLHKSLRERLTASNHENTGKERSLRDMAMTFRLREPDRQADAKDIPSRLAFWRVENDVWAAAITNTTTVTERAIRNRAPLIEQASDRLHNPNPAKLEQYASALCRLVIPHELKEILKRSDPLVIEVDRWFARVQWEALPAGENAEFLTLTRPVARQLRTFYSPRPFQPDTRQGLKALIIGDPGGPGLSIQAAREEALEVRDVLRAHGVEVDLRLGSPEAGTGAGVEKDILPADYFEVVSLLLKGGFDIVHYSGHATFDPLMPARTGWVFATGVLTAHDLDGIEQPPRLVVANACLSSQLSQQVVGAQPQPTAAAPDGRTGGDSRLVAGLADEFFKQGVSDYIGAAWEVPSNPAKRFAREFYRALLSSPPVTIGVAVQRARKALYDDRNQSGAAWAAYHHYGDPTRLIAPTIVQRADSSE